jgi:hypothetical protein
MSTSIKSNANSGEILVNGISELTIGDTTPPTTANAQGSGGNELARKDYVDNKVPVRAWVTTANVIGTTYTNNYGHEIDVSIMLTHPTIGAYGILVINGVTHQWAQLAVASGAVALLATIPIGATYVVGQSAVGLTIAAIAGGWRELR